LAADTHGVIAAAAAHERTSAGAITTTRSAASSAVSTAPVDRLGRSQITVAPPRLPASITAPSGAASMSLPVRLPDNTRTPCRCGNASRNAE
jgi:hypothetical protein